MANRLPIVFLTRLSEFALPSMVDACRRCALQIITSACLCGVWAAYAASACWAATLTGSIADEHGNPLPEVVVTLSRPQGLRPADTPKPATVVLDQRGKQFIPHVLPVRVGTSVMFPNSDETQHHVYSFSDAKRFEIKLYRGLPSAPILFDRPGIAALGCNIHDWMLSYVYVTETPYFTVTDSHGHWRLDVPDGTYRLSVWHADASEPNSLPSVMLDTAAAAPLAHRIGLKRYRRSGKPPENLQVQSYDSEF